MRSKAFTLIELLVVISIIGVLSSIVLVSFSGSRDKARLAKAQNFDAQVSHALGAYAVGIWRFEEGAGTTLHDESGFENDGTFIGNPIPVFPEGVYSGTTALQFDGVDDYVNCGNNPSLGITDAITVEAWVKPNTVTDTYEIVSRGIDCGHQLQIFNDDVYWRTHTGFGAATSNANNVLDIGKWAHLVGTYNGSEQKIYVNGIEQDSDPQSGLLSRPTYITYIGCRQHWPTPPLRSRFFDGLIDDVRIYNEALSSAQIQQHFAAGAASHGIAANDGE